jgi:transcription antitermination protein NusB
VSESIPRPLRRQAHQVALQALFEHDTVRHPVGAVVERLGQEAQLPPEGAELARRLVSGVAANLERIDGLITDAAPTWPLGQMARVDKNVLRLAIYEAFVDNAAVSARAAINDAIELAKTFGSESSSKFVNGVLATLAERRPRGPSDTLPRAC